MRRRAQIGEHARRAICRSLFFFPLSVGARVRVATIKMEKGFKACFSWGEHRNIKKNKNSSSIYVHRRRKRSEVSLSSLSLSERPGFLFYVFIVVVVQKKKKKFNRRSPKHSHYRVSLSACLRRLSHVNITKQRRVYQMRHVLRPSWGR